MATNPMSKKTVGSSHPAPNEKESSTQEDSWIDSAYASRYHTEPIPKKKYAHYKSRARTEAQNDPAPALHAMCGSEQELHDVSDMIAAAWVTCYGRNRDLVKISSLCMEIAVAVTALSTSLHTTGCRRRVCRRMWHTR